MSTKTLLTLADFERLTPPEGVRYELDEGEIVTMAFPRPEHNRVVRRIYDLLSVAVRAGALGELFFPDTPYVLSRQPATLRGPDLSFIRAARLSEIDLQHNIEGGPDLAIEVVSPTDSAQDLNRKVNQYLRAGSLEVWIVYPETQEVHIYNAGAIRKLDAAQVLESTALLPGFSAPVKGFFAG
jgi:Uma2 family endonuclease